MHKRSSFKLAQLAESYFDVRLCGTFVQPFMTFQNFANLISKDQLCTLLSSSLVCKKIALYCVNYFVLICVMSVYFIFRHMCNSQFSHMDFILMYGEVSNEEARSMLCMLCIHSA